MHMHSSYYINNVCYGLALLHDRYELNVCILHVFSGYDKTFNVQPQPIQFLEEPKDHVTLAGADVTFVCSTTVLMSDGLFTPHTTWLYNNTTITSGDHYIISHNGDNTLTVKNVTRDDQGVYHCHVDDWKIKIRSRYGHLNGKCTISN